MTPERRTELDAELKALNDAVDRAIKERREWMDAHMTDYARFQVGEEIYDIDMGRCVGIVSELYRYPGPKDPISDRSMRVHYQYKTFEGRNCYDNTSRDPFKSFGSKQDAIKRAEARYNYIRGGQ